MIYNSTNFIFYDNNNDSYDKPWQNLLHKISSAYMTKPFGVVKIESGASVDQMFGKSPRKPANEWEWICLSIERKNYQKCTHAMLIANDLYTFNDNKLQS